MATDPPIEGYDDMTVTEVAAALAETDLSAVALDELADYEAAHKDRVTALDAITDARDAVAGPDAQAAFDAEADAEEVADSDAESDPDSVSVDTDAAPGEDAPEPAPPAHQIAREACVVAPARPGHIAGFQFDTTRETRVTECGPRVEAALDAGLLERVEPDDPRYHAATREE